MPVTINAPVIAIDIQAYTNVYCILYGTYYPTPCSLCSSEPVIYFDTGQSNTVRIAISTRASTSGY